MKRIVPLLLTLALLLTGCTAPAGKGGSSVPSQGESSLASQEESSSTGEESASDTDTAIGITDSNGTQITLHTATPRVVAAYGSFAEAWLLAGGELCGVTQDALEERDLGLSQDVAVVGTVKEPNAEEIIALDPDLVILASDIAAQANIRTCWKTPALPAPPSKWTPLRTTLL